MIKVCKAKISDAEVLAKLSAQTFLSSHGHSASKSDIENYVLKNFSTESYRIELTDSRHQYYLIYFNNQLAGYSKIVLDSPQKKVKASNITYMSRLYLLKEFYGQNLGAYLFDFNIDISKKNNQTGIWLAVWVENIRAIAFYKKMGFVIIDNYDFPISETHSNPNHIMYLEYK